MRAGFGFQGFGRDKVHNSTAPRFPALTWTPAVINMIRAGNTLFLKNGGGDDWNGKVASGTAATSLSVDFNASTFVFVGFSANPLAVNDSTSVDMALFCHIDGNVYLTDNGVTQVQWGTWAAGDILRFTYTRATGGVEGFKQTGGSGAFNSIGTFGLFAANLTQGLDSVIYYQGAGLSISAFGVP